jgi:hypothetical protein
MRIITPLVFSATLAVVPFSVSAWEHEMERGVDLYQTADPVMVLSLVCDPNSVYGTTVSAVMVGVGSDLEMNAVATFRFPDLITIQATLDYGRISKSTNEGGAWEPLLAGFRSHSTVEISVDDVWHTVSLGDPMPFSCT